MIPIGDDNSNRRTTPVVNWLLVAANVFVFVFVQGFGSNARVTLSYALVPGEILSGHDIDRPVVLQDEQGRSAEIELGPTPIPVLLTLFTSMFLHGGLAHILGNMLYLVIFGDNVEDALGHARYLVFYLVCGAAAGLSHVFVTAAFGGNPLLPTLGASGAISGVLGAYIVLFPRNRVRILWLFSILEVPAIIAIGIWFAFQLVSSAGMLGAQIGGVAYGAHIGGFLAGVLLVRGFRPRPRWVRAV